MIAFLDAKDYETTVKNAIFLCGDADTMACIAGGIAQTFYKAIPADIVLQVREKLPKALLALLDQFNDTFNCIY
ncbi:MAG: ADP-ribosylglycohydrolase family protein [Desulfosarcina sp.]|nr:ADP-ribosylglycohydrolase family protein [Desulfosarcina sp.]